MQIGRLVVVILVVCGGAGSAGASEDPPLPEATVLGKTTVEVPMDLASGRPVVQVRIDGGGPYGFILDTGASATLIDQDLASRLGLPVVGETGIGDCSDPEAFRQQMVKAGSLEIGDLRLSGVTMITFNIRGLMGPSYGGVLGFPSLAELLVTLDCPDGRVVFTHGELPAGDPRVVEYRSAGALVSLPVSVAGHELPAHLDSGNPGSFMLPHRLAKELRFVSDPVEAGKAGTVNNLSTIWSARIDGEIEVGGLVYRDPEVLLSDLLGEWANMGFAALSDVVLTVDQKNHRLRMVRTEGIAARRQPPRRVGVMFEGMGVPGQGLPFKDGGLVVRTVASGSLAEAAGIKEGDTLLSINGRPLTDFGVGDLQTVFGSHEPLKMEIRRLGKIVQATIE